MSDSDKISMTVLTAEEQIEAARSTWEEYQWSPFYHPDDFFASNDGEEPRPYVFLGKENDQIATLLAGRCSERRLSSRLGSFQVRTPKLNVLMVPSDGVLVDKSTHVADALTRTIDGLFQTGQVDVFRVDGLALDSPILSSFARNVSLLRRGFALFKQNRWRLSISGDFQEYVSRHKKLKTEKRYLHSRVKKAFSRVEIEKYFCLENDLEKIIAAIEQVSLKSWQHLSGERSFSKKDTLEKLHRLQAGKGFRCYVLSLDSIPAAFNYGYLFKRTLFLDGTAFDPEFSHFSPGTILQMEMIKDAFADGEIDFIDFGVGNDQGKKRYSDIRLAVVSLTVYAPRIKPVLCNLQQSCVDSAHLLAKTMAERLTLAGKWRKFQRTYATGRI